MKYILISLISLLTLPVLADDDNQINITQIGGGNAVEFRIDQYGYKNIFDLDLDGQNAYIRFVQNGGNNTVNAITIKASQAAYVRSNAAIYCEKIA